MTLNPGSTPAAQKPIIKKYKLVKEKPGLFKSGQFEKLAESCHKNHLNNWTRGGVFGEVRGERKKKKKTTKEWT